MVKRGKIVAIATAVVGVVVLVAAGFAAKDWMREEWFIHRLRSAEVEQRQEAAEILGDLRSKRAVPALEVALADEAHDVMVAAAEALQNILGPCRDEGMELDLNFRAKVLAMSGDGKFATVSVGNASVVVGMDLAVERGTPPLPIAKACVVKVSKDTSVVRLRKTYDDKNSAQVGDNVRLVDL